MMRCSICSVGGLIPFSIKTKKYNECSLCGSITLSPECFETEEEQRNRYEQHHNNLQDEGYRTFLENFIIPVLKEVTAIESGSMKGGQSLTKILDYGSGPEPALCELLKAYAESGRYLCAESEVRGWDPFFAPETAFFEDGADLVTCLEVAEHFESPVDDMKKLSSACRPGGYVAIGTMLFKRTPGLEPGTFSSEDINAFKSWWYRSDSTHVSFYTFEGLKRCAENAGLSFVKEMTDRSFLFRKKA